MTSFGGVDSSSGLATGSRFFARILEPERLPLGPREADDPLPFRVGRFTFDTVSRAESHLLGEGVLAEERPVLLDPPRVRRDRAVPLREDESARCPSAWPDAAAASRPDETPLLLPEVTAYPWAVIQSASAWATSRAV